MEAKKSTFAESAGAVAVTAHALVERYQVSRAVDPAQLRLLKIQAQVALSQARGEAVGSLDRANIEQLIAAARTMSGSELNNSGLHSTMFKLGELTARLVNNLDRLERNTTAAGAPTATLPVQIYVDETAAGPIVERELLALLAEVGIVRVTGNEPVIGSWYRRLFGTVKDASGTHTVQELRRAAEIQLIDRFQAGIDGATAGAVSTMIAALANTRGAVIQAGSVLLVKLDDKIVVRQLTPEQLLHWNENPGLFSDPAAALTELQRAMEPSLEGRDASGRGL